MSGRGEGKRRGCCCCRAGVEVGAGAESAVMALILVWMCYFSDADLVKFKV